MNPYALARSRAVWALAVGQTLGYACLFYIFAALIVHWHADLGWGKSTLALGPMLAILISAGLAPFAGRLVDRGLGPESLTWGAVLGGCGLIWLAFVQTPAGWLIGWAVLGLANAAALYEVCFAFLIRRLGDQARAAIIRVTLVAGFASTFAFPVLDALARGYGWRVATLVAAALTLGVTAPLHHFAARAIRRAAPEPAARPRLQKGEIRGALVSRKFALLAGLMALVSLNHWMVTSYLIPIFALQGASAALAVLAASLIGPAQVVGRLALMRFEARIGNAIATRATLATLVIAALVLTLTGLHPAVILTYVALQGAAMGVITILRPVLIADVMGHENYGTLAGAAQMPALLASALAPMLGALMLDGPGLWALMALSLAFSLAAFVALALLRAGQGTGN